MIIHKDTVRGEEVITVLSGGRHIVLNPDECDVFATFIKNILYVHKEVEIAVDGSGEIVDVSGKIKDEYANPLNTEKTIPHATT